jgi:MFS family permease
MALVGAAMFGTITYVPLFVQGVIGTSATSSGVVLTPFMLGAVGTSILSGQLVSRIGRYKQNTLLGPLVLGAGLLLLWRMTVETTNGEAARDMVIAGAGMGLMMQTFVLAVQNALPQAVMGVATAATQFARLIGATIGVTVMGALLTTRLHSELAARLTPSEARQVPGGASSFGSLVGDSAARLPARVADDLHAALAASMHSVFVLLVPVALVALIATMFVESRHLRRTMAEEPAGPDAVRSQRPLELASENR